VNISQTKLPGLVSLEPRVFTDQRGHFCETFRAETMAKLGIPDFVQENQSRSIPATLRGLHYQLDRPQGKLVRVVLGEIYDVAVDIRTGSQTFGDWFAINLSAENRKQLYIPPGFAHGFCVVGNSPAEVVYKCTDYYSGAFDQRGVMWNDPALAITWPVMAPLLSEKDQAYDPFSATRKDLPVL